MSASLKPCPFCGCEMRVLSNRVWHHMTGEHDDQCAFDEDEDSMCVPADATSFAWLVAAWNRRPAPQGALTDALPELPKPSAYGIKSKEGHDPDDPHKMLIGLSCQPFGSLHKPQEVALFTAESTHAYARQYAAQCIEARNQQGDAIGAARYELVRTLSPWDFTRIVAQNIAGEGKFDDLVDAAIEQRKADKKGGV